MSTLLKPIFVRNELLRRQIKFFTPAQFILLFGTSPLSTKYFLETQTKQKLFLRLKKGLYCLATDQPADEEIANRIYQPSYLSLEYVLSKQDVLPESVYVMTSVTTKPTRTFSVENKIFSFLTIKKSAYTGYNLKEQTLFAEPEKALVDYLYFVSLGEKSLNDRFDLSKIDKKRVLFYTKLFARPGLEKLVRKIL